MKQGKILGIIGLLIVAGAAGFLLYTLTSKTGQESLSEGVRIVTTTYPLEYVAKQIGQDKVIVTNVVPQGTDPHDFDPSPAQVGTMLDATVLLYNGAGLDAWVEKLREELASKSVVSLKASANVELLPAAAADEDEHQDEAGDKPQEQGENFDPHFWLDPTNMIKAGERLYLVLDKLDPANTESYRQNFLSFKSAMESLDQSYLVGLKECQSRKVVVSHNYYAYPAKKYSLDVLAVAGLSLEAEPGPAQMAELVRTIRNSKVTTVFTETLGSRKIAETLAQETGAQVATLNPLEGLTSEDVSSGKDYTSVMRDNLEALRLALQCQ